MPRSTGLTPNEMAIWGRAVAITVPSRNSMKNAPATSSGRVRGWSRKVIGLQRDGTERPIAGGGTAIIGQGRGVDQGEVSGLMAPTSGSGRLGRNSAILRPFRYATPAAHRAAPNL